MKTCSAALQTHLSGGQTTLAWLWKVKRVDGTLLGFTTHDVDITYTDGDGDNVTYLHSTGFTSSATAGKSDLSVDNMEVMGFLNSSSLSEGDLRAGFYDGATIEIRVVNWNDLTMGDLLVRSGTVGQVKMKNGLFTAELRGLAYRLTTILGSTYGPVCRSTFGSGLNGIDMDTQWPCMVDVTAYQQTGSVSSVPTPTTLAPTSGLLMVGSSTPAAAAGSGWFDDGIVTFSSGVLDGQSFEIRTWDGTTLTFYLPLPKAPSAADTFTIQPGCNHLLTDCRDKFDNVANRHAEDFVPGPDSYLNIP